MVHLVIHSEQYNQLLEALTVFLEAKGYRKGTRYSIHLCIKELLYKLEERFVNVVRDIDQQHLQEHYQYLTIRPKVRTDGSLSSSMLGHHVYAWRVFFAWLESIEAIHVNPLTGLDFPRPFSPKRRALLQDEIQKLYAASEQPRDKALLGVFYACGLRRSEGVALNNRDIDHTNGKLIVREGKFNKRREIPLHPKIISHFREYRDSQRVQLIGNRYNEDAAAFLINNYSLRMTGNAANDRVKYLAEKAELQKSISLHHLRHSVATHLKENGMKMEQIKEYLGHSSLDVTQGYLEGYSSRWKNKSRPYQSKYENSET